LKVVDWVIPLLVVLAFAVIGAYFVRDLAIEQWQEESITRIQESQQLTPEQQDEQIEALRSGEAVQLVRISTVFGPLLGIPLACLVAALVLTLIIGFGLGGSARFSEMWAVACLAWVPHTIRAVLFTVLARAQGSADIHFGPAALVPDDGSLLRSVLGVFDLFDLWMIGIHMVGVGVLTTLTKGKARTAVLILWITYWVLAIALVIAGRKLQGLG
jgi:hypothetical protein